MVFQPSFFEDEVRDGFFVSGKMKRFWAAQLEVLDQIDRICRRHGLTYFADYGTLLGAARHGGFIPWDDDLDVCMKREEMKKLISFARKELPEGYEVFEIATEADFDNLLIRVVNCRVITFEPEMLEKHHGSPYAAGLDIFPLDHLAPTPELDRQQVDLIKCVLGMGQILQEGGEIEPEAWKGFEAIEKDSGLSFSSDITAKKRMDLVAEWLMSMYNEVETGYLVNMGNHLESGAHSYPTKYFDQVTYLPFEGFMMPVSVCYDAILRTEYGDYMRPIRGGSAHNYPGFSAQDETMKEILNGVWCGYEPEEESLTTREERVRLRRSAPTDSTENADDVCLDNSKEDQVNPNENQASPTDKKKLSQTGEQLFSMAQVLHQATQMVSGLLSSEQLDGILELLEQCQTLATNLGEAIEKTIDAAIDMDVDKAIDNSIDIIDDTSNQGMESEDHMTASDLVHLLEEYCNQIYFLYQYLVGEEGYPDPDLDFVLQVALVVLQQIELLYPKKETVVFIAAKADWWGTMEPYWQLENARKDADVFLMPVPWYHKNLLGNLDEMIFEPERFPSEILESQRLAYDRVSLEALHPDRIYTQDPFGNVSAGMSLHPFFYTSRIWNQTEECIYIPPMVPDEAHDGDERGYKALEGFCNMPGVLWADKVVLPSETMRGNYKKLLLAFTGDVYEPLWEERLMTNQTYQNLFDSINAFERTSESEDSDSVHGGSIGNRSQLRLSDLDFEKLPEAWKAKLLTPNGSRKKILCFHMGSSVILKDGDKGIEKLTSVLEEFSTHQEKLAVLWWIDEPVESTLGGKLGGKKLREAFKALYQKAGKMPNLLQVKVDDRMKIMALCDAYYGDGSYVMNLFVRNKKPVMQMDL